MGTTAGRVRGIFGCWWTVKLRANLPDWFDSIATRSENKPTREIQSRACIDLGVCECLCFVWCFYWPGKNMCERDPITTVAAPPSATFQAVCSGNWPSQKSTAKNEPTCPPQVKTVPSDLNAMPCAASDEPENVRCCWGQNRVWQLPESTRGKQHKSVSKCDKEHGDVQHGRAPPSAAHEPTAARFQRVVRLPAAGRGPAGRNVQREPQLDLQAAHRRHVWRYEVSAQGGGIIN